LFQATAIWAHSKDITGAKSGSIILFVVECAEKVYEVASHTYIIIYPGGALVQNLETTRLKIQFVNPMEVCEYENALTRQ
jgi:hypothetical protein